MFVVEAATESPRQTVNEDLSDNLPLLLSLKELQVDLLLQDSLEQTTEGHDVVVALHLNRLSVLLQSKQL